MASRIIAVGKLSESELRREYDRTKDSTTPGDVRRYGAVKNELRRRARHHEAERTKAIRKSASRKPATSAPLKPGQYRTMSGRIRTIPVKKTSERPRKEFTKEQRRLIAKALRLEQKRDNPRLTDMQHRIILDEQRQTELKLSRLNKEARQYLDQKIRDYQDKKYNRTMRDIKKKEAFQRGKFTAGYWLG